MQPAAMAAALPQAEGFLVEAMVTDGIAEVIVGARRDELFGMTLLIGAGGILTELLKDTASLLLPVSERDVRDGDRRPAHARPARRLPRQARGRRRGPGAGRPRHCAQGRGRGGPRGRARRQPADRATGRQGRGRGRRPAQRRAATMSGSAIFAPGLLEGRHVLVTGGGTGIGLAIAREVGALGARVTIAARREEVLKAACEELRADGIDADWRGLNIRDTEAVEQVTDEIASSRGLPDFLVNNAGGQFGAKADDISPNGFRAVMDLNVQGNWQMSRAFALAHRDAGTGAASSTSSLPTPTR